MNLLNRILMYPEPAATGGGEPAPAETTPEPDVQETPQPEVKEETKAEVTPEPDDVDPFDFDVEETETETDEEKATEEEYTLGFTEEDGIEAEVVESITKHAKSAGIEPEKAAAFIRGFKQDLDNHQTQAAKAEREQSTAALKELWGSDYNTNLKQTAAFMQRKFKQIGLTPEQAAVYKTPEHFAVFHKLMTTMQESNKGNATPEVQRDITLPELVKKRVQARHQGNNAEVKRLEGLINSMAKQRLY